MPFRGMDIQTSQVKVRAGTKVPGILMIVMPTDKQQKTVDQM